MSIIDQAADTIYRFNMMEQQDRVLVAVSGGPDSMALIHVLQILAPRLNVGLAVAHLNHGIRPGAAQREEVFVRAMAQNLGLPFFSDRITLDHRLGSLEERARRQRYAFLARTAEAHGYTKIAVGHHADDNAEALLIHLLRGSGNRGLGAIPPVRDHWIVRPLIQIRRERILAFLKNHQIDFVQDESNDDIRFIRNRIRHRLLPMLEKEFNPGIVDTLNRTAMLCREEEAWFRSFLKPILENIRVVSQDESLTLKTEPLSKTHPALQRRLIREALIQWQGHLQHLAAVHVDAVTGLLGTPSAGQKREKQLNLPGGVVARITGRHLRFFIQKPGQGPQSGEQSYSYRIESKHDLPLNMPIHGCNGELMFTLSPPPPPDRLKNTPPHRLWLDADKVRFPLIIRNARKGDRLNPFGMNGRQKIKKLFINAKIPRHMRRQIPLLVSENNVLWIAGIRRGSEAPVTETTRQALCVQWSVPLPGINAGMI